MRYIFGTLALLAAIVIVGYSATTLFMAAFNSSSEPWQQWLNGTGAASVVAWEATALLLIGWCWTRGYKPVAFIASLALVAAVAATLSWEGRAVIGGQADKFASREIDAKKLQGIEDDLKWLRLRREKLSSSAPSPQVRKDLEWISNRLAELEDKRGASHAVKEVLPQAAWAHRVFGGSEQMWQDVFTGIPLLFWMLARIVAIPLAVAGMSSVAKPAGASQRAEAPSGIIVPPMPTSPALSDPSAFAKPSEPEPSPVEPKPEPPVKPKKEEAPVTVTGFPPKLVEKDPRFSELPKSKKNSLKGSVQAWKKQNLIENLSKDGDGLFRKVVKASDCWLSYLNWCKKQGYTPIGSDSHFGRQVGIAKNRRQGRFDGAYYLGFEFKEQEQEQVA